jgi:branched-chain amino acid transport system ATP-binding protein
MPEQADLKIDGLAVRYGHIAAVNGISLSVGHGSIVAVLGANGAGKTSTLNALAGISPGKVSGLITLFGRRSPSRPHRVVKAGMVLVPEGRQVFSPLTVADNLLMGAYSRRGRRSIEKTMAEVYDLFPVLHERRNSPAGLLSGGEQQMLAFGRAMMSLPKLILMDEPSMGLAPIMVDRVMSALTAINARGSSILVVEQNAAAVLEVAHYAYVLNHGRIIHEGTAKEVMNAPIVVESFLGLHEEEPPPDEQAEPAAPREDGERAQTPMA